jgi:hypothetical protein
MGAVRIFHVHVQGGPGQRGRGIEDFENSGRGDLKKKVQRGGSNSG